MQRVVVDPEVPADVADLLRRNGPLLYRFRTGRTPRATDGPRIPRPLLGVFGATTGLGALAAVPLAVPAPGVAAFLFGSMVSVYGTILSVVYIARKPSPIDSEENVLYRHSQQWQGHYLILEDFDYGARNLLGRVQRAIDFIVHSRVNALGMLDRVRNAVMLPAEEWEIARLLTKLSALRAKHRNLARGGRSPEVTAAMVPLERALSASEAAVVARVEALERYAGHVAEAEKALRAQSQLDVLRQHLPEYEQLVAETGAARFSAPEIGYLSDDAETLRRALRDSFHSAHEAFRHLDGPPPPRDAPLAPGDHRNGSPPLGDHRDAPPAPGDHRNGSSAADRGDRPTTPPGDCRGEPS
ncbi:hypothetical protein FHS43_002728 [Streptosporangium becharense]|uniref:Uncharacterized protein n=1 Tax=Streptosporangium becharense TaxID=1816182 RepID=A0A7W9IL66_9ACTN|nr:hypothetical protein [Streptosporangium becharense]MBB2911455.1 hypothetical protein [Streptosporangium becharense]MBB5822727.1 hypothetical protein [Streptosporangium becharense]